MNPYSLYGGYLYGDELYSDIDLPPPEEIWIPIDPPTCGFDVESSGIDAFTNPLGESVNG